MNVCSSIYNGGVGVRRVNVGQGNNPSTILPYNAIISCTNHGKSPVVVVTQPLLKDGGMAEDHGAPEAGQLLRA